MQLIITADYDEMSRMAADLVVNQLRKKPSSLICFPSGESPAGMFRYLVADSAAGEVDMSRCFFVALDEWVGLGADDDGSCTRFLNEHFFDPLSIDPARIKFFDAKAANLDAACAEVNEFVAEKGPIDLMIVGIGMNGHIGLNEPGTSFNTYAHHSALDSVTVSVGQKYFKQQTQLTEGITLGLKHLQEAKLPVLLASGARKADIVTAALKGEITEKVPASIFQKLSNAVIILDEAAATRLIN